MPLLNDLQPDKVLTDTAYDSDENRIYCAEHGLEAVIPSHPSRLKLAEMDEKICRDCNKIERFFSRLKQYLHLAVRYENPSCLSSLSGT